MVDPQWNETFAFDFDDENDQPLMLMFDVLGTSEMSSNSAAAIFKGDDHLGSTCRCPNKQLLPMTQQSSYM